MVALVLDIETTLQWDDEGRKDGGPYHPQNRIVSVGVLPLAGGIPMLDEPEYHFLHHAEFTGDPAKSAQAIQEWLDKANVLVAHNAKFDLSWLLEAGFKYEGRVYCTQIGEYVLARGTRHQNELSLAECCERYKLPLKKSERVEDYLRNRVGYDKMPLAIVKEYGVADVLSCAHLYLKQLDLYADPKNTGLVPTRNMMNEYLYVLSDMERAGMAIDVTALDEVEEGYKREQEDLTQELQAIVREVMGDTPVNLASPEQLSSLIYSRRVNDKAAWATTFNLGKNARGKPLPKPKMSGTEFAGHVRRLTTPIKRTTAVHCKDCHGTGKIRKTRKDGTEYKREQHCPTCGGKGFLYVEGKSFAGLRLHPTSPEDVTANGFATDADTLERLAAQASEKENELAVRFLQGMMRLNAVEVYISAFCGGIRRGLRGGSILHCNFNQCIAKTGRLASSNPNLHNLPRGSTAPIRRTVVSRWKKGKVLEADFTGLEFRVAGELSGDPQIFEDVLTGKDIHKQTASIIFQKDTSEVTKPERQDAKPYTFAPLYGGKGMSYAPHIRRYFDKFFDVYEGMREWHKRLLNTAVSEHIIRIPSGREYAFPNARRNPWGGVTGQTQIVNYPVQGFATGDIVPCAVISIWKRMRTEQVKSVLINSVHDSVVADVYPGEEELITRIFQEEMENVRSELKRRYGYEMRMPLATEIKIGSNWLNGEVVHG